MKKDTTLMDKLECNTNYFKAGMKKGGFNIVKGDSAILPVMLCDNKLTKTMVNESLKGGVYVNYIPFSSHYKS